MPFNAVLKILYYSLSSCLYWSGGILDYYPFGMLVPNRHADTEEYRYGFQGQEKDKELKGEGNSLNYTFRMHDPRIGRFFTRDPLFVKYPYYSPYIFSGNRVIDSRELEGAEPGLAIGSERQVVAINQFNNDIPKASQNWAAFQLTSIKQALTDIQSHKKLGNKIKVLLLQAHANSGNMYIFEGSDGILNTKAVRVGETYLTDDKPLTEFQLNQFYIPELERINKIKSKKEKAKEMTEFRSNAETQKIDSFLALVNEIEDGGTLILNGCHVFSEDIGKQLSEGILKLTNKKINILGPQDYVSDLNAKSGGKSAFGGGMIPYIYEEKGYLQNSEPTNSNLQLNATGDKLYELIPIIPDANKKKE
ncbi:RHS repeat domain-containing protein [Flavobacterium sp. CLA17]|uniref:RHS repeat domain-containing protein n=1 Tax=Flavobacterium sp. CLA17 TaxID=2724135 RepID=UPI001491C9BC|nr:RHS repeat-associated core domain-containing protein [Flavobacterium sp. CLA17]QSB27661.1 hypothetical protein HAV12_002640 [Flavobacterium sp. CLA17]